MNNSRRIFLKKSAMGLAGATLFNNSSLFAAAAGPELLGLQLYSVREEMNTDALATLKQVAAIGYKNVEHAGYGNRKFYGYPAAEFKKILSGLGMKMPSGHTILRKDHWDEAKKDFSDEWKTTVEDAAIVGQQFVISPALEESLRHKYDDVVHYMDIFNKCGELCKKSGMKFGYHNHDFEFSQQINGGSLYDIIMKNTDPDLVIHQLDIGNMYNGGAKALDIMKRFPGRYKSMHVKDEILSTQNDGHKYESTILGEGIVPVKEVIDLGRKSGGTIHFIIEQESYQSKTPVDSVKEDFARMKKWGY
ncbi:MAG: TIM barrel protein [Flavitalea sp.]